MKEGSGAQNLRAKQESRPENGPVHLRSVVADLLQRSSVYAVSQLASSGSSCRKALWVCVLVVGLLGCAFEVFHFLGLYFRYPVVITLDVENDWKIDFPAVTVCDLNSASNQIYECLQQNKNSANCGEELETHPNFNVLLELLERYNFSETSENIKRVFNNEAWQNNSSLKELISVAKEEQNDFGVNFITQCLFDGKLCSIRNFTEFRSQSFGTCLTFNLQLGEFDEPLVTHYVGPNSGLDLTLNLNAGPFKVFATSVGARVVIHDSATKPNPEDYGINIFPGFETSFSIKQISIHRLQAPYKDRCERYAANSLSRSREECFRLCIEILNLCPYNYADLTSSGGMECDVRNRTGDGLHQEHISESLIANDLCSCPLPCRAVDYEMTISLAEWPSVKFFNKFLKPEYLKDSKIFEAMKKQVKLLFEKTPKILASEINNGSGSTKAGSRDCNCTEQEIDNYRNTHAKLQVFYKTLDKTSYIQEPMFQDSELFSQLGGQLGLWLGVSLMALFECAESFYHLMHFLFSQKQSETTRTPSN